MSLLCLTKDEVFLLTLFCITPHEEFLRIKIGSAYYKINIFLDIYYTENTFLFIVFIYISRTNKSMGHRDSGKTDIKVS